jgi:hypothetical protein
VTGRLFYADDRCLVWPVIQAAECMMQVIELSNIPTEYVICGLYCHTIASGCYIYVACKPTCGLSEQSRCHIYVYEISINDDLLFVQDMRMQYKPMEMETINDSGHIYMTVLGSDKDLHVYEVEQESGKLNRCTNAESFKETWKIRLGFGTSICLRLLVDESGDSHQCVTGFVDGHLYWHRTYLNTITKPHIERSAGSFLGVQNPGSLEAKNNFWCALLLDTTITSIAMYKSNLSFLRRKHRLFKKINVKSNGDLCPIVVVGLSDGSILLLTSNEEGDNCNVLCGVESSPHGSVLSLCVGDIYSKGTDNIIAGHVDGTLIIYTVHPEYFSGTVMDIENIKLNDYESKPLEEVSRVKLPFPIVSIDHGCFFSEKIKSAVLNKSFSRPRKTVSFHGDEHNTDEMLDHTSNTISNFNVVQYGQQLVVLTTQGFHMFSNRYESFPSVFFLY